jgi:predicted nucleic acid-binding protein
LRSGGFTIGPITDSDIAALETLMVRYRDRPNDFADATLVHRAHRESLVTIMTVDHNDFETYRIGRWQRFRVLPERQLLH